MQTRPDIDNAMVDSLRNLIAERIDEGSSRFPGMSYEQGIRDVLEWLFDEGEQPYL